MKKPGRSILLAVAAVGGLDIATTACSPFMEPGPPYEYKVDTAKLAPVYVASFLPASGRLAEDSLRNPIRVYADTLYFTLADTTFIQATRFGSYSTGSEVLTNRRSSPRRYTLTLEPYGSSTLTLPGMLGGTGTGFLSSFYLSVTTKATGSVEQFYFSYQKPPGT
jgi:hypothetical protein